MTWSVMALLFAIPVFALGRWGTRNAAGLAPRTLSAVVRESKERAIRRGALACQVFAGFFVLLGIAELVMWAIHR
ncbi:hypothetical protein LWP59_26515 [Amycolatopsis acidiphila]|uniref:Uncharacterized protein n=1 Tax=Amycolatopsis acidiphila TaxID=715473 RepID=A0A557ZZX2_9PSEU|nr:hypothetical protein [Amycolatopsis acidiphila]TVT17546.1 hypothetical protein FNH06_31180 [Amycolatopsis acidiphila]UIJ57684.1 hypothetical protein LWP59_26515 [Amycolatopsis acidiphila]GHG95361.1 hypothetical protein GCM10017788_73730 [Amycolatopsis acidiphila]